MIDKDDLDSVTEDDGDLWYSDTNEKKAKEIMEAFVSANWDKFIAFLTEWNKEEIHQDYIDKLEREVY